METKRNTEVKFAMITISMMGEDVSQIVPELSPAFIAQEDQLVRQTRVPFNAGMDIQLQVRLVMISQMTELDALLDV